MQKVLDFEENRALGLDCSELHCTVRGVRVRMILIRTVLLLLLLPIIWIPAHGQAIGNLSVFDESSRDYLWSPAGWMPDGTEGGITFQDDFEDNCINGNTCVKISCNLQEHKWVGIYWLSGGTWIGPGVNIYDSLEIDKETPVVLTFWAKGESGEESAQFNVGGLCNKEGSIRYAVPTKWIYLSRTWKKYEIDLSEEDLTNVVGAFCWTTKRIRNPRLDDVVIYLDDIRFEAR